MNLRLNLDDPFLAGLALREVVLIVLLLLFALFALSMSTRAVSWLANRLRISPLALHPLQVGARILIWVLVATILAGHFFQVNLITALGGVLALIAIGFVAVWSVLSNVLCTLLLLIIRPFGIGDHVEIMPSGASGVVKSLNLFFTTLEKPDGQLVQIPNNLFFQGPLLRRPAGTVSVQMSLPL